jgi:hypothetical protein
MYEDAEDSTLALDGPIYDDDLAPSPAALLDGLNIAHKASSGDVSMYSATMHMVTLNSMAVLKMNSWMPMGRLIQSLTRTAVRSWLQQQLLLMMNLIEMITLFRMQQ